MSAKRGQRDSAKSIAPMGRSYKCRILMPKCGSRPWTARCASGMPEVDECPRRQQAVQHQRIGKQSLVTGDKTQAITRGQQVP